MPDLGTGLILGGTLFSASQQYAAGKAGRRISAAEAAQMEQNAGEAVSASQRRAREQRRKFDILQSRALALAGSGASDPQIMRLVADLAGEGAYQSALELYEGESQARNLRAGAAVRRAEGESIAKAGRARAISTLIGGGGLLYKYGGGGPQAAEIEERTLEDLDWPYG